MDEGYKMVKLFENVGNGYPKVLSQIGKFLGWTVVVACLPIPVVGTLAAILITLTHYEINKYQDVFSQTRLTPAYKGMWIVVGGLHLAITIPIYVYYCLKLAQ